MSPLLLVLAAAHASPTRLATSLETESQIEVFAQTSASGFVAFLDSAGDLGVLDTRSWSISSVTPSCTAKDVALFDLEVEGVTLYAACTDGSLAIYDVDEYGSLSANENSPYVLDEEEGLIGVVAGEYEVWAASDDEVGVGLHDYTPATETGNVYGPYTTGLSGYSKLVAQGDDLVILHGGDDVTKVGMMTGSGVRNEENLAGRSFVDAASDGDNLLYLMDSGGAVVRFILSPNEYQVVLNESADLETCSSIALQAEGEDAYLALAESTVDELRLYPFDSDNIILSDTPSQTFSAGNIEALFAMKDFLLSGGNGTALDIYAAGPWVDFSGSPSGVYGEGESFSLSFTSDVAGDWGLHLDSMEGTLLAEGTASADTATLADVTVSEDFSEGMNRLYVVVDDGSNSGYDSVLVDVNNPPSVVLLDEESVGFGDGELVLSFEGIVDEDLVRYDIYYSEVAFTAEEYETGGPETSMELEASPGEAVSTQITGLVNGSTYYVGIRAVDDSGKEGAMSEVIAATPEPAVGAAQLAGETGGCTGFSATQRNPVAAASLPFMLLLLLLNLF